MEEYLEAMAGDLKAALEQLQADLGKVRTGRATPKLLDGVQVNVPSYGAVMPLNQLCTVQAPDARLLQLTPWDKSTIPDIERAIIAAGLGLNPSNDGQVVRLPVPALTADRRKDLIKMCGKISEESKVRIRGIRREYNDIFKEGEKDGDITEDDSRRILKKVQDLTDEAIVKVDKAVAQKEAEVQEI